MKRWHRAAGALLGLVVMLAVASCGSGGGSPPAATDTFYVDAQNGNDVNSGTAASPWRTLAFAMANIPAASTVFVRPGLYVEPFGIVIPPGVAVLGDEATKGKGVVETRIRGGSLVVTNAPSHAIEMGSGAVLAGVIVENDRLGSLPGGIGCFPTGSAVTLRNCCFQDSLGAGVSIDGSTQDHVITGCEFTGNGVGLAFNSGGDGTRVEGSLFSGNTVGVAYAGSGPGGDLGGGAAGSTGGNVLRCNTAADLGTESSTATDIYAEDGFWDHVAPSDNDIVVFSGAAPVVHTMGAQIAPNNCP